MFPKAILPGAALAALATLGAPAAMATTLTTSLAAFQAGVGGAPITGTPNPGAFDLTGLFLPTTGSIALNDGQTLTLSTTAQVTAPQNGFPYLLGGGFAGELFVPVDANGNNLSSETITFGGGLNAIGFTVAPYGSASGAPNFGVAGGPYTITVTLAGGGSQAVTLPGGTDNTGTTTPAFFGAFGGGLTALTITTSDPSGLAFGNFVDVPAPASSALLLGGILTLAARRRRQPGAVA